MKNRNHAFTLIELLIVIAIIGLLSAILFPVFTTAREKARQATCMNNLKQISTAMMQYTQDYDEQIVECNRGGTAPGSATWDTAITPYVCLGQQNFAGNTGQEVALSTNSAPWAACPDDTVRHAVSSGVYTEPPRSYAMIQLSTGTNNTYLGSSGQPMSKIASPSTTLLLVEFDWFQSIVGYYNYTHADCPAYQNAANVTTYYPGVHSGGWNYLFCDGHVKWLNPEQTLGPGGVLGCNNPGPRGMWTITDGD